MELEIRRATPEQAALASAILTEAAAWLIGRGEKLWEPEWLTPEKLRPVAERGELYLAWLEGEPVGTITLQWEDEPFWPDVPAGESAFFHKLAVRRGVAGHGVSRALVGWALEQARAAGKRYLRMDCAAERPKLRAFYESLGFEYHSDWWLGSFHAARYQLELSGGP